MTPKQETLTKSHTLPSNYVPPEVDVHKNTASTAKLTLSSVKDIKQPKNTASVIKIARKGSQLESQSDSQTGHMSPASSHKSGDFRSLETLTPHSGESSLPDVVRTIDNKNDTDSGNISIAMEALDSAIALLSSVSLETSTSVPLESIATMPIAMLSSLTTSAVVGAADGTSLCEPLIVEVMSPTVLEAPSDILIKKDTNQPSVLPDLTKNGTVADTSVVLATSTIMTPIQTDMVRSTTQELPTRTAAANSVLSSSATSVKLDGYPANMTQPVATVPPIARYRDVTKTTDSGMYKTITSAKEFPTVPKRHILSDDSDSIISSESEHDYNKVSSSLSSELPEEETADQRRQRLMRSDSFNRPDSPEVEPLPLPKDSVIVRSRLRRMDSSSSTDSCSTPPRSPRVSPRMPRKPKSLRQLLESTNIRGFAAEGPSSKAHLGVPKAAMW